MARHIIIITLMILSATLLAIAAGAPSTARVVEVVDGDTIKIQAPGGRVETVRLIGIDAPELRTESTVYARKQLQGQTVRLTYDRTPRDRYGRILAYVWKGQELFNLQAIRDGQARAFLRYEFRADYMARFRRAQAEAKKARLGMWAGHSKKDAGFKYVASRKPCQACEP